MAVDTTNLVNLSLSGDLAVGDDVTVTGDAAVTGTLTVTGATTLSTTLTAASVRPNLKRVSQVFRPNNGGTLADGTTYAGFIAFGRAGTIKNIVIVAATPPAGGTNTVTIKKASSSGNTVLSAATYDPTALVANTVTAMTLTATTADLALTAAQGIYIAWAAGTQTTDAINVAVVVEFEPDDY